MLRRTLACTAMFFATACSDGTQPDRPDGGSFSAMLRGARSGQLTGVANAGLSSTELGESYSVRMFDTGGGQTAFITLTCLGSSEPIAVGRYQLVPGQPCEARYGLAASDGFSVIELALAESGSMTVSVSNEAEIAGSFRFQGALVEGSDTVGVVSATGSFRAVQL